MFKKSITALAASFLVACTLPQESLGQEICARVGAAYLGNDCYLPSPPAECSRIIPMYSEYFFPKLDFTTSVQVAQLETVGDWEEFQDSGVPGGVGFRWTGPNYFNTPGHGRITFTTYLFSGDYDVALSMRKPGPDDTEHNDVFLAGDGVHYILSNGSVIPANPLKVFLGGPNNQLGFGTLEIAHLDHHPLRVRVAQNGFYEFHIDGRSTLTEIFGIRFAPSGRQHPWNANLTCDEYLN